MNRINKKFIVCVSGAILLIFVVIVLFVVFGSDRNVQRANCELYFLNETGTTLVAEEHEIKYYDKGSLCENVVLEIIKGPSDARNKRVIGKNVELLNITPEADGNIVVNFSKEYLTNDSTRDALAAYAVVKSLCALDSVERVKVAVEGEDLKNGDGTVIGYLTSADINLPTDTYTSETREITLYFPRKDSDKLYKEQRTVKITDQQPVEQYIISELIKGPIDSMLNPALNADTSLLSVDTYGDICFVNFKSDFIDKNSGDEQKEKIAVYSIVDSLTEIKNIKRIQFLMDGKKVDKFGSINIRNPIERNSIIVN